MMRVLVTGASGFIGERVCARVADAGYEVVAAVRRPGQSVARASRAVAVGEICATTDWRAALAGCDTVIHLAARTHQGETSTPAARQAFWRTNVDGTDALAKAALAGGVRSVVFVSSAKVYGERSPLAADGTPRAFSAADRPAPEGPYGASKWAAEQLLERHCAAAGAALIVLRPPLVYGPRNRGNLFALMQAIARGVPLPLASIANLRSLIYVEHLVDGILLAARRARGGSATFTLADTALSTPSLVRALAQSMRRRAMLLPCPVTLLRLAGAVTGRRAAVARLIESFLVDSGQIGSALGWSPRISLADAMAETGAWYRRL